MKQPLWIDESDAVKRINDSHADDLEKSAALSLVNTGIAMVPHAHDAELCNQVILDYRNYVNMNYKYVRDNLDELGREKRLVNFHHFSDAAMQIGSNKKIMSLLDYIFDIEASIYTSLTFKYGSQQPVHRDSPHFATWPRNYFCGVWTALEDIKLDAGPVFYHPGAHRFNIDEHQYWGEACKRLPNDNRELRLKMALDLYNGEVIRTAPKISQHEILELNVGDTLIWHAEMPHGGMPAKNPQLTRWSIVFHCAPVSVQVHQHEQFFTHDKNIEPERRYTYYEKYNRRIANAGEVAYM